MNSNRRTSFPVNALRRSPRRRTKTPSVNELSKKCKISPRGKRRLEFRHEKPLKGRTYYLDLQGYRKIGSLQARIKELGGAVEEFLSKDISCVITNRKDIDTGCSPRSNSTPSPILSVPSPFRGNTKSSSAKGSAVPSPLSADSAGAEQTGPAAPKHNIRGKALAAQAALTCKYGTSNIIANARNWGLEIVPLEKMLEELGKYGTVEKKPTSKPLVSGRVAKQGVKPKVRKLHAPFIKVEDHSRCYKPLVHELKEWPKIDFDGPLGSCPFDSPKIDLENDHDERDRTKRKQVHEDKNKKKGFCECCCVHYEDLDLHLHSDRHRSFARDSSNYRSLDELIKKGPSLQDFLDKMMLKHEQKQKENQEKNRNELSSPGKSSVVHDEQKTPTKQNRQEILPNCQTPIDHIPDKDTSCHTPTNPSPVRKNACHTPTTHSSPEKNSIDDDTPTRVLRARGGKSDVTVGETREQRSSPRTPNALKEKDEELCTPRQKEAKKEMLNSEKTSDKTPEKLATHAKTRSTSSDHVAACSTRGKSASCVGEKLISQSPDKTRPGTGMKKSPVKEKKENAEETRECVRTRTHQSDSSNESSSSKENYDPELQVEFVADETVVAECHVGRSELRSGTTRDGQQHDKHGRENENRVQSQTEVKESEQELETGNARRTSLRTATKMSPAEEIKNSELPTKEEVRSGAELEKGRRSSLRSAAKMSPTEQINNSELPTKEEEGNVAEVKKGSPRKSILRSASKMSPAQETKNPETTKVEDVSQTEIQEDSGQELKTTSPRRVRLTAMTPAEEIKNPESPTKKEERISAEVEKGSPRRSSLGSATKTSSAQELKHPESPNTEKETSVTEEKLERNTRSRTQSSPKTTKQLFDDNTSASEEKACEMTSSDVQVTMETATTDHVARLSVQSAPTTTSQSVDDSVVEEDTASDASSPVTQESSDEEKPEFYADERRASSRLRAAERERDTRSSRANTEEMDKSKTASHNCVSRASEVVVDVKVKLSDCRGMCAGRNRPVLERESEESETDSIQLSSDENDLPSEEVSTNKTTSDEEEEEISSTPTLDPCASPSSDKSGYTGETDRYSLRKRAEQKQQEDPSVSRRTRSNYKVHDEESKNDGACRERRKTVSLPFTNVESKSPKQRCQSVKSCANTTPERKTLKNRRAIKSPLNNSPRGKVPIQKEPSSESDSSTFSGSPRSGPSRETRSTHALTHSVARSLKEADGDTENEESRSVLSDIPSLGDLSTVAVRGTPPRVISAGFNLEGDFQKGKETSLPGTKLSKQQGFQDRKPEPGVARLFDSDDEEDDEEFYGFDVPQFDGSFSSEGDLSFKINSIVESMKNGDASQDTIDDAENVTIQEIHEDQMNENAREQNQKAIDRREISRAEQIYENIPAKNEEINERQATRKRKSTSQFESSTSEAKRIKSDCLGEGRSFSDFCMNVSSVIDGSSNEDDDDDVDEDDDVFSSVSDSSDGEEEEVASPFSITSWRHKRKSEDLQQEVDRPAKRRKSDKWWTEQTMTEPSSQSSKSETPVKYGMDRGIRARRENEKEKSTSFTSKLDEMLQEGKINRVQSFSSIEGSCEFYDSDEPVIQTLEERVKLRRLRRISRKAHENSSSLSAQNQDSNIREAQATTKEETLRRAMLPLKPLKTVSPNPIPSRKATLPLKPLQNVSTIQVPSRKDKLPLKPLKNRSSSRLNRVNSSPSLNQSSLDTPSGKRRPTWIYDLSVFASPPSEVPSFGGKRFTCSTPESANPSKHSLMLHNNDKMAMRSSKQNDAFAFDE